ncbi:MAG: ABC transporter ATP-binding protein [Bacteroidota bacterium]|nr:ABC transporter ATP-binding protein [Bacteroidota bacterium]
MPPPIVDIRGLDKTYMSGIRRRKIHALRGVDLSIERGEVVGILGPNGAGKTTLLKILLGIVSPSAGGATLFGQPAGDPRARARLGYLPENHRFPPYLTARQTLDVYGRLANLDSATREANIPILLESVGLSAWGDTRVGKFSKGMMQRLGLAQSLLNSPKLVVLDEPTDGVDPVGRRDIRDRLRTLKEAGTTILINSHLLLEIELVCDRVIILDKGRIIQSGSVDDVARQNTGWRIQLADLPPTFDAARFGAERDESGRVLILESGDPVSLNALIDALRAAGIGILGVERHRASLEAGFIDLIIKNSAASGSPSIGGALS